MRYRIAKFKHEDGKRKFCGFIYPGYRSPYRVCPDDGCIQIPAQETMFMGDKTGGMYPWTDLPMDCYISEAGYRYDIGDVYVEDIIRIRSLVLADTDTNEYEVEESYHVVKEELGILTIAPEASGYESKRDRAWEVLRCSVLCNAIRATKESLAQQLYVDEWSDDIAGQIMRAHNLANEEELLAYMSPAVIGNTHENEIVTYKGMML